MKLQFLNIKTVETPGKGSLSFFEGGRDIPFKIKRVYYITDVPKNIERGGHAHRRLSQLLFCPSGEIEITLDDGFDRERVILNNPSVGLLVNDMVWREMKWLKEGSTLVVAASEYYDEKDYIRNYNEFIKIVTSRKED